MTTRPVSPGGVTPVPRPNVVADVPTTALDLATLLALVERRAVADSDGHLTLLRFTTGWKCLLDTPDSLTSDGYQEVWQLPAYPTLREALTAILLAPDPSATVKCREPRPSS